MVPHEEYLALRERAAIVERSDRGRLRLTGADRRSYLQGLLTNDIEALIPGTGCDAALLTAQGRMLSDMRVLETGDEILLDLPLAVTPKIADHLSQFIFSEDVVVEDVTASLFDVGAYGPKAPSVVAAALGGANRDAAVEASAAELAGMPVFANVRRSIDGTAALVVRSDDIGVAGFDLIVQSSAVAQLVQRLAAAGAVQVRAAAAEVCRVEAGRPAFGIDMDEDTIPLEAGITERAISMTKGCYVGQEVIIRVLHRGHGRVARRLVGMKLESDNLPSRGAVVKSADREIGRITSAVLSPAAGPIALGYVHRDFTEPGTRVRVGDTGATVVETPFV